MILNFWSSWFTSWVFVYWGCSVHYRAHFRNQNQGFHTCQALSPPTDSDLPPLRMCILWPRVRTTVRNCHLNLTCVLFMDNPLRFQLVLSFEKEIDFHPFNVWISTVSCFAWLPEGDEQILMPAIDAQSAMKAYIRNTQILLNLLGSCFTLNWKHGKLS